MDKKFQISDSELVIMKVLWESSPLKLNEVVEALEGKTTWNSKTIHTLIRRLVEKKALGFDVLKNAHLYYPLITKEQYLKIENETFLQKLYNGSVSMMMTGFLKHQKISKEELERLKKIIEGNEGERR